MASFWFFLILNNILSHNILSHNISRVSISKGIFVSFIHLFPLMAWLTSSHNYPRPDDSPHNNTIDRSSDDEEESDLRRDLKHCPNRPTSCRVHLRYAILGWTQLWMSYPYCALFMFWCRSWSCMFGIVWLLIVSFSFKFMLLYHWSVCIHLIKSCHVYVHYATCLHVCYNFVSQNYCHIFNFMFYIVCWE